MKSDYFLYKSCVNLSEKGNTLSVKASALIFVYKWLIEIHIHCSDTFSCRLKDCIVCSNRLCVMQKHICNLEGKMHPGESFTLELWATEGANVITEEQESITTHEPRYTLSVLDILHAKAKNGKFAIFIVPQGTVLPYIIHYYYAPNCTCRPMYQRILCI